MAGNVREIDRDGKTLWQFEGVQYPIDAQVVGPDRVLVAEYNLRRVTERDFKGNVLWQKQLAATQYPLAVQRLPGGNTFIVTQQHLLEIDRDGRETFTYDRPKRDIMAGAKLRDGQYVCATRTGQCIHVDGEGREVKSFPTGPLALTGTNIDGLPNGRVLVPQPKVVEYDFDGRALWEVKVANPTSVMRLPNGNTLVGSMYHMKIVELDRAGKVVRQMQSEGQLKRVRQR
jgi:hypothetical protein